MKSLITPIGLRTQIQTQISQIGKRSTNDSYPKFILSRITDTLNSSQTDYLLRNLDMAGALAT
jgi:hypothetical protein